MSRRHCVILQPAPPSVSSDLLLHLDNNFDDSVSGRTRVYTPSNSFTTGKFGNCYNANGEGSNFLRFNMSDKIIGTQDFTVDMWLNCQSYSTDYSFRWIFAIDSAGSNTGMEGCFNIRVRTTGKIEYSYRQNNSWCDINTGITLPLNSWHHLCCVRSNGVMMFFLDGVKEFEAAMTAQLMINQYTYVDIANDYSNHGNRQRAFNGYIDEFRLVIGTAVWTSDFTPPTSPYDS